MKDRSIKFFSKIEATKRLPTLPHILLKLFEACDKKPVEIETISQIINKDASLSARLMSMVNPVCYGQPNRIKSIDQILLILGSDTIKNIAISSILQQSFNQIKSSYIPLLKILWKHSLMSAVLAKTIAKEVSYSNHNEAYLAGLFHDIGKLVLWVNSPKEYSEALQATRSNRALLLDSEKRIGASHDETGAWLINSWALQSFVADAVLYHHETKHRILDALPLVKSDLIKITHESLLVQSGVQAKLRLETSIPPIITDKNGLKQVVINLIKNAVEAMPDGGDIEISTGLITKHQNNGFNKKANKKEQKFVEIIISDSGSGIPKEIKSNLFEPFVSLKGNGHSGLGLSIAYSIINGLKGTITCESEKTIGTIFKILLPLNDLQL